jgi:predicted  nucleic acid-binding Zn-ribbon protein
MNIYYRKQNWKIALGVGAIIIIVASLLYTNYIIQQVAREEKNKINIWVEAIQKKAQMVKNTTQLFDKIKQEERKRIEIWAQASKMITTSESSSDLDFYLKILNDNTTIPVILTDLNNNIDSWKNIDDIEPGMYQQLSEEDKSILNNVLKEMIQNEDTIHITIKDKRTGKGRHTNTIYYKQSKIFDELKSTMDRQMDAFITEIVNNYASVPVVVTDDDLRDHPCNGQCG